MAREKNIENTVPLFSGCLICWGFPAQLLFLLVGNAFGSSKGLAFAIGITKVRISQFFIAKGLGTRRAVKGQLMAPAQMLLDVTNPVKCILTASIM
jgi:hypothetical protein